MSKAPARLVITLFCLIVFTAIALNVASVYLNYRAKHVGLSGPNAATGQIQPLKVCNFHGPCWTVYVTPDYAGASQTMDTLAMWGIGAMCVSLVAVGIAGHWLRKRKGAVLPHTHV